MSQSASRKNLVLGGVLLVCVGIVAWQLWSWMSSTSSEPAPAASGEAPTAVGGGSRAVAK